MRAGRSRCRLGGTQGIAKILRLRSVHAQDVLEVVIRDGYAVQEIGQAKGNEYVLALVQRELDPLLIEASDHGCATDRFMFRFVPLACAGPVLPACSTMILSGSVVMADPCRHANGAVIGVVRERVVAPLRRGDTGLGAFILLNKERTLRLAQEYVRRNVGRSEGTMLTRASPLQMIGPGIGAIVIGAIALSTYSASPRGIASASAANRLSAGRRDP
jgi:hypothetical protein